MLGALLAALLLAPPVVAVPPPIGRATIDDTLEIEGADIAARQVRTRMEVPVTVDGQGPYRFFVDSGADRTVIGAGLAERLGLERSERVLVNGMAGATPAQTVRIGALKVGDSTIENVRAPALAEANLGADGLLGIDALADQRLAIDFEKKSVTIQDSRRAESRPLGDEIVVVARRRHGQLILTEALAGRTRLSAVIDTGAQVSIGNSALRRALHLDRRDVTPEKVTLVSVTGQSAQADLIVIDGLTIGKLDLSGVAVAFADVPPFRLFGLSDEPAMLIGTDVLQAFRRVALDFRRRRVRFTLRN